MNALPSVEPAPEFAVLDWSRLDAAARAAALARPALAEAAERAGRVAAILAAVRADGDAALREFGLRYDRCVPETLAVPPAELRAAAVGLAPELIAALAEAAGRIEAFHRAGMQPALRVETAPGVICERVSRPIERVGLYVPAGSAPLPSTALMLGVPARLAGCREVVLCSPPGPEGRLAPAVLEAARLCGITRIFRVGGAQAIAAMAFGTESIPRCDKIFGPGNAWVTEAKRQVAQAPGGPAIDLPAGPSEVLVIADADADPRFVAADLLSQAEHGPDSQVLLLSDSPALLAAAAAEIGRQLAGLPRSAIARQALAASRLIRVDSLAEAVEISNRYAPEHLILNVRVPRALLERVVNAGSIFLGAWAPESTGDYCSGTNHVLPTGGHARALGGLGVESFRKQISVQELTPVGLRAIGPCAQILARAEGLEAHARAVDLRLAALEAVS